MIDKNKIFFFVIVLTPSSKRKPSLKYYFFLCTKIHLNNACPLLAQIEPFQVKGYTDFLDRNEKINCKVSIIIHFTFEAKQKG